MRFPLNTLHKPILQSSDPEAKYSPFGENNTIVTQEKCFLKVLISSPLYTYHKLIFLRDPDAKYSPFGEKTTLET